MSNPNKNDKTKIIIVSVSAIAAILIIMYVYISLSSSNQELSPEEQQEIVLNEDGEASYLNLSVPNSTKDGDSLSLIENLEKIKNDSINSKKINTSGLEDANKELNTNTDYDAYSYVNNNRIKGRKHNSNRGGGGSYVSKSRNYSSSYDYNDDYNTASYHQKNNYQQENNISSENYKTVSENLESSTAENDLSVKEKKEPEKIGSGFFNKKKKIIQTSKNNSSMMIYASIHGDQSVMSNNRVKMRLSKETIINGYKFPTNTILYGTATIQPNRLLIVINKINQIDVKLEVYDAEDSNKGLYVLTPNLNAFIKKELKNDALENNTDLNRIPLGSTIRNLLTKKIKEEKIEILNNYKLIIKERKEDEI